MRPFSLAGTDHGSTGQPKPTRAGLSLLELLVAIGIIGLLISLLLPAVASSREASRKIGCSSNLRQVGLAIQNYESTWKAIPYGRNFKWAIWPYLDSGAASAAASQHEPWVIPQKDPASRLDVPAYRCPSDGGPTVLGNMALSNYAGCYGSGFQTYGFNGFFAEGEWSVSQSHAKNYRRVAEITDGLSNTAAVSEMARGNGIFDRLRVNFITPQSISGENELDAFADYCETIPPNAPAYGWGFAASEHGSPWWWGEFGVGQYNHVLPPNRPSCHNGGIPRFGAHSASSFHPGGVNLLMGDGSAHFQSSSVDRLVWRKLASIAGNP